MEEKILKALKVFDNDTILYDSMKGETVTFQDVIDFIESQREVIAKRDELIELQRENINTTHANNMELREEIERLTEYCGMFERGEIGSPVTTDAMLALEREKIELQKQVDELKQENSVLSITVGLQEEIEKQAVKDTVTRFFDELEYASEYFDMGDGYIYKAVHIDDVYTIRDKIMEGVDNEQ